MEVAASSRGQREQGITLRDLLRHRSVAERAADLAAASAEVNRTFDVGRASGQDRESGPAWQAWRRAIPRDRRAMQRMYPDPLWPETKARLRDGDPSAREVALVFLEVDPWCFRSGYEKADLMKALACLELGDGDQERVCRVILHVAQQPQRREYRRLAGLAASVWSPSLERELTKCELSGSDRTALGIRRLRQLIANRLHERSVHAASGRSSTV